MLYVLDVSCHFVCVQCRSQVWQFHRRFDEHQPYRIHTNPLELWRV